MTTHSTQLSDQERAIYEWQMWLPDLGEEGQEKLKNASVMVSRVGGVGSVVAYELAAAGVGKLVLAHAGNVKPSDLNRQLLMTHDWIGKPRVESIERRLLDLNPRLDLVTVPENVNDNNAESLVDQCDLIVDCAPLFTERFAMNQAAVNQGKVLIECAMYDMEAQLTTIVPKQGPCLRLHFPRSAPTWKREFPVLGRCIWYGSMHGSSGSGEGNHGDGRIDDRQIATHGFPTNDLSDHENRQKRNQLRVCAP